MSCQYKIMDIQSFIQSGLLETYMLGQCTPQEQALVERMLAQHPEIRAEMSAIEAALENYAVANSAPPPPALKGRILDAIDREAPAGTPAADNSVAPSPSRLFLWVAIGLAVLGGILFFLNNRLATEKNTLETQVAELQQQIDACNEQSRQKEKLQQVNLLLRDRDDTQAVAMSNGENGKFTGYAYLNTARCEVAVDLQSLPAPDPGKYFQLWSIVNGAPVSMGMIDLQATGGWLLVPCQAGAVAIAISQESSPNGNPTPTQVLMAGNIAAVNG